MQAGSFADPLAHGHWPVQNQVKDIVFFSKSTPSRNQVDLTLAVRLRFYVSIIFCHPQFHGVMFRLFLCFPSPRFFVFAEKGIIIFMIFRAGRAHLTANPSGRRARACTKRNACWGFFNCSAYLGKVSPGRVVHDKSRSLQPRLIIPAFDRSPRSLRTRGLTVVRYSRLRPPTAYILSQ